MAQCSGVKLHFDSLENKLWTVNSFVLTPSQECTGEAKAVSMGTPRSLMQVLGGDLMTCVCRIKSGLREEGFLKMKPEHLLR